MVADARHGMSLRLAPPAGRDRLTGPPLLYRGAKSRTGLADLLATDHAEGTAGGRFRWLVSTCLAATVGAVAILVVIFGSADPQESGEGLFPALRRMSEGAGTPTLASLLPRDAGLRWSVPKSDRLEVMTGALSTRYIIHETLKQKRGGREYIYAKPYVRIVERLAPVPTDATTDIPPFNPFKLYANSKPIGAEDESGEVATERRDVSFRVVELLGGILPGEDGQELDAAEAEELADKAGESDADSFIAAAQQSIKGPGEEGGESPEATDGVAAPNTTVLAKSAVEADEQLAALDEGLKRIVKTVGEGDKLVKILTDAGADTWQVREIMEAMKSVFPQSALASGQEVHITLAPSLTRQNRMEPVRFSIYDDGHAHKVTVTRSNAGEFIASATPLDEDAIARIAISEGDQPHTSSLYASLYHASFLQNIPADTILQILRVNAYQTDFRRRLRAGDSCELFFDLKEDSGTEGPPGELLYTAITAGGETQRYYRYRTPDGVVDFYDASGSNSKKFLMRRPVRGDDVRLTSGYGMRFHPLLNERRMHTGVDWATTPGSPVLAAGNGTIEEAGRKGQYGNYVRIRHANGYQTAYGHLSRYAQGAAQGVKVRQGQIIGYVGSTGLSSGPHVHFEVLVNNQFVDPLSIQVPTERQLIGRDLAEFQKERARIDDLMRRSPVMTASK